MSFTASLAYLYGVNDSASIAPRDTQPDKPVYASKQQVEKVQPPQQ